MTQGKKALVPGHGNTYWYRKGCRCDDCRAAEHEAYVRRRTKRGYAIPEPLRVFDVSLSAVDAAYLAGFFDGEGSIGVYPFSNHPGLTLALSVGGTDELSIRRFQLAFGGSVSVYDNRKNPQYKRQWKWKVSGARAKTALSWMIPYLTVKKGQAFEALKIPVTHGGRSHPNTADQIEYRTMIADRIRTMKAQAS